MYRSLSVPDVRLDKQRALAALSVFTRDIWPGQNSESIRSSATAAAEGTGSHSI